jgi:uncharacterized RDD family membrane protein YckC
MDLPLFQSARSETKIPFKPIEDGLQKPSAGTESDKRDIRSLIDSIVVRQAGSESTIEAHQKPPIVGVLPGSAPLEGRLILVSRTLSGLVDLLVVAICTGSFIIATDIVSGIDIFDGKSLTIYCLLLLAVFFVYSTFFLGTANQTIGMMLTDLKIIDAAGERPRIGQILWRCFGYLVSVSMFGVGLLWGCFNRQSRCLHDRLSDTHVVRI